MSVLVTLADLKALLGTTPATDDALLQALLDDAEAMLAGECARAGTPFQAAQTGRVETKDGTGNRELYLDYAIAALSSITLGFDPASPDETLDVSNKRIVRFAVGSRRVARVDGGVFGRQEDAQGYVTVTYNTQADLPSTAPLGIKRVVAALYRQRGSEGATHEEIYRSYVVDLAAIAREEDAWQAAVAGSRRMVLA